MQECKVTWWDRKQATQSEGGGSDEEAAISAYLERLSNWEDDNFISKQFACVYQEIDHVALSECNVAALALHNTNLHIQAKVHRGGSQRCLNQIFFFFQKISFSDYLRTTRRSTYTENSSSRRHNSVGLKLDPGQSLEGYYSKPHLEYSSGFSSLMARWKH